MKKNKFALGWIIGVSVVCVIAVVAALVFILIPSKGPISVIQSKDDYYTVNYTAVPAETDSYLHYGDQEGFTIVDNVSDLNSILLEYNSGNSQFDDNFFKSNDVLLVDGLMGPEVHSLEYVSNSLEGVFYTNCPLMDFNEEQDYVLLIIPIKKNITNVDIDTTCYPGRVY